MKSCNTLIHGQYLGDLGELGCVFALLNLRMIWICCLGLILISVSNAVLLYGIKRP